MRKICFKNKLCDLIKYLTVNFGHRVYIHCEINIMMHIRVLSIASLLINTVLNINGYQATVVTESKAYSSETSIIYNTIISFK